MVDRPQNVIPFIMGNPRKGSLVPGNPRMTHMDFESLQIWYFLGFRALSFVFEQSLHVSRPPEYGGIENGLPILGHSKNPNKNHHHQRKKSKS